MAAKTEDHFRTGFRILNRARNPATSKLGQSGWINNRRRRVLNVTVSELTVLLEGTKLPKLAHATLEKLSDGLNEG